MFKNKYIKRAKITEVKFRLLLRFFSHDLDAQTIADLVRLNRNTINRYLRLIRLRLVEICNQDFNKSRRFFIDENTNPQIFKKKHTSKYKNNQVFGIVKNGTKIHAQIAPHYITPTLQAFVRGDLPPEQTIHIKNYCNCDSIVDVGCNKQYRIIKSLKADSGTTSIDIVEAFWSFAKLRLTKFYGIRASSFNLHLKECEFRFNHRKENLYKLLLCIFRNSPL